MKIKPNIPIAIQASNILRKRLRAERFEDNRLPGELAIADELGISRGTVRQALAMLEQEGVISRHQGSGTYINPHVLEINARVDVAYEFTELIEAAGFHPTIESVGHSLEPAAAPQAAKLKVDLDSPLLVIRKLFRADGDPAIYVVEHIPQSLILEEYTPQELKQPIFQFLSRCCQQDADYILSEIIPTLADDTLAGMLGVLPHTALQQFDEVFYSAAHAPLCLATVFFRSSFIRFHTMRKIFPMR